MEGFKKLLMLLVLSSSLIAPVFSAEDIDAETDYVSAEDGEYLIDESDAETLLDGELTPEGEAALAESRARQANSLESGMRLEEADSGAVDGEPLENLQAAQGLDAEIQTLKEDVLNLNRELFSLEEELLFPSNTQFAVYVSVDVGEFFDMESVRVLMDNKPVASYLYTKRESDALMRGGVHRIYMGNLTAGTHELVAYYTGRGPRGRDFKRATKRTVNKEIGPKYVELKISDNAGKKQSGFEVKEW